MTGSGATRTAMNPIPPLPEPDFSRRSEAAELMDLEPSDDNDYHACLANLARVNALTLAYRPTLSFLDRATTGSHAGQRRPLTVVDVGCGYGDMLRRIGRWAARRRIAVHLVGIDLNPRAVCAAAKATPPDQPIRWIHCGFAEYQHAGPVDLVVSSLFTHHLDDAGVIRFLSWMEATAQTGWFINDLHRHRVPYYGFRTWSRMARWHRFIRHDGPVSIARAFVRDDWVRLLPAAGFAANAARIEWWTPFRLCVSRLRNP